IHRRFGIRIWVVRTTIEVIVLAIGWVLGGTVGLGTVAFALLIGPMVGFMLPWLRVPDAPAPHPTEALAAQFSTGCGRRKPSSRPVRRLHPRCRHSSRRS